MSVDHRAEDLLRELAPQVLGALVHRYGVFDACEDAVQEALLAAALQWPAEGVPDNPRGWLVTVASRRLVDQVRSEHARRRREDRIALATPQAELISHAADAASGTDRDDSLALLFLCCHPALSEPSRIALTLRAVGGLTTAQIATAFLVPEATMAQRISRAKQTTKASGMQLRMPEPADHVERLGAVLHVLYLIFNEGYTTTDGAGLTAPALSAEALRLTRLLHRLLPDDGEAAGLLALMLLTEARRPARTGPGGCRLPPPLLFGASVRKQVAWLTVEDLADAGQRREADRAGPAVLQDGQVHIGHADPGGELRKRHAAFAEHAVEMDLDPMAVVVVRHHHTVPSRSSRMATPARMMRANVRMPSAVKTSA